MTIISPARCKHCKFLEEVYKGKLKRHRCSNDKSPRFNQQITKRDLVCDVWEL